MDVTKLLEKDHEKVSALFEKIEGETSSTAKDNFFRDLQGELEAHSAAEEAVLYPQVKQLAEAEELVEHSEEEHAEIRSVLGKLPGLRPGSPRWDQELQQLKKCVEHHVKEEEGKLFPKLRELLSEARLRELGDELEAAKGRYRLAG